MSSKESTHSHDKAISKRRLTKPSVKDSEIQAQPAHPATIRQLARRAPGSLTPPDVLQLQRTIGNQAVGRLLATAMPGPATGDGGQQDGLHIQGKQHPIQMKPGDEEDIQLKKNPSSAKPETVDLTSQQKSSHSGMPEDVQAKMEDAFNASFSDVKIYPNSQAAADLGAFAYTQGNDIHFAPGKFEPSSLAGQELLGHELTHVIQQRQGRVKATAQAKGVSVNDDPGLEREADSQGKAAGSHQIAIRDAHPLSGSGLTNANSLQPQESHPTSPKPANRGILQMKAGVDLFEVKWKKNDAAGAAVAKLRLDYKAKFKKDKDHNPAHAEFRQNIDRKFKVTDGPHKGLVLNNTPMHDDNYSRSDDTAGNKIDDVDFVSNDNPGASGLDADDVVDYTFTAEQLIIDTSDSDKVIAKRGPHTATINGKHPREYDKALPFTATGTG